MACHYEQARLLIILSFVTISSNVIIQLHGMTLKYWGDSETTGSWGLRRVYSLKETNHHFIRIFTLWNCFYFNFRPNLNQTEAPWQCQIENLRFYYSPRQKLKEEARVTFKVNEMLFHCLDNLFISLNLLSYFPLSHKSGLCY